MKLTKASDVIQRVHSRGWPPHTIPTAHSWGWPQQRAEASSCRPPPSILLTCSLGHGTLVSFLGVFLCLGMFLKRSEQNNEAIFPFLNKKLPFLHNSQFTEKGEKTCSHNCHFSLSPHLHMPTVSRPHLYCPNRNNSVIRGHASRVLNPIPFSGILAPSFVHCGERYLLSASSISKWS